MRIQNLQEETLRMLQRAGWSEDRSVDVSEYVREYVELGWSEAEVAPALDVLRSLGGIRIQPSHEFGRYFPGHTDFFVDQFSKEKHAGLVEAIGSPLWPIGESGDVLTVVLSGTGAVYSYGINNTVFFLSDSLEGALNHIAYRPRPPAILCPGFVTLDGTGTLA